MRLRNHRGFLHDWSKKGQGRGGEGQSGEVRGQLRKGLVHHCKSFQLYSEGTEELWEDFKLETATIQCHLKILVWAAE